MNLNLIFLKINKNYQKHNSKNTLKYWVKMKISPVKQVEIKKNIREI